MLNRSLTLLALLAITATTAHAAPPSTPTGFTASLGTQDDGIRISWNPVETATSYNIVVYPDFFSTTALATIATSSPNGEYTLLNPCGTYRYFEIRAVNVDGLSLPSSRVFGYTATCAGAVQSCEYTGIPLSGEGSITFSTVGSLNSYQIANRPTPCEDGNDPGTAGTGLDMVFPYRSAVDCTLTVTLDPDGAFQSILYIADTCEATACDYYNNNFSGNDQLTVPIAKDTTYYIFVDGYNNFPDQSAGTFTLTLDTEDCAPATSCTNAFYSFNNGLLPPGWTTADRDNTGSIGEGRYATDSWTVIEDLAESPYNNVAAAYSPPGANVQADDWLIAGPFRLNQDASIVWRDARTGSGGSIELDLYIADTPTPEAFLFEGSINTVAGPNIANSFTPREVPLTGIAAANGLAYVAFRHRGTNSGYLLLDDIGICADLPTTHTADQDKDNSINLSELLRVIQLYTNQSHRCAPESEDGFAPGGGNENCIPHASDYNPTDWTISLDELLRLIQLYNATQYELCYFGEDAFCIP